MSILNRIGQTPLVAYEGVVPNGNRIFIKEECANPWGSHYDRVYKALFAHYIGSGRLVPGMTVLETTSGSAGVSFAGIGRELGFRCIVAIPEGGEKAREDAVRAEGAELIFTSGDAYVSGFPAFLRRYLPSHPDVLFLNHSMGARGTENRVTTKALEGIALEALDQLDHVDFFVPAIGNGSSVLGPGRAARSAGGRVVTFESFQSGVGMELLYPGRYAATFGIEPGSLPRHRLPGTSFQGIDFPHIRLAFEEGVVNDTFLVSDHVIDEQYRERTGRHDTADLPHWDAHPNLPYGRTTRAGLAVALQIAESVKDQNIVIIGYDKPDRYDD